MIMIVTPRLSHFNADDKDRLKIHTQMGDRITRWLHDAEVKFSRLNKYRANS